jgi:hypothetical protein
LQSQVLYKQSSDFESGKLNETAKNLQGKICCR